MLGKTAPLQHSREGRQIPTAAVFALNFSNNSRKVKLLENKNVNY
jgi:hypothetical protein